MTRLTAYEIASNPDDIVVTHAGPDANGKYSGWITRGEEHNYKPLLSSNAVYDSAQAADNAMEQVVVQIKKFVEKDLAEPGNPIAALLSSPEGAIVENIVVAARR